MFYKLLVLNWRIFLDSLTRFQIVLISGYVVFMLLMFGNLLGSALVILFLDTDPRISLELPWLNPLTHKLLLLLFANVFWVMHFSFTSVRLLNFSENRKLLGFGYPTRKVSLYMNLIGFFHPINLSYNITWLVFLLLQVEYLHQVPLVMVFVLLNYGIIYSFKHRFLAVVYKRFAWVVIGFFAVLLLVFQGISYLSDNPSQIISSFFPRLRTMVAFLSQLPGGLLLRLPETPFSAAEFIQWFSFGSIFSILFLYDHHRKTMQGLLNPAIKRGKQANGILWKFCKRWLGINAGKYYFYVMSHPYNRLQLLTVALIPTIYVPLLLQLPFQGAAAILIPTMLAAIPVALLAMGMANMYGYEQRELLLHMQLPVSLESQLKERFLGVIVVPLLVFYIITAFEALLFPEFGNVITIFVSNTFVFLCFMLIFLWSSYYQFQRVVYSSFSYKHPIISQKVTFVISFMIFLVGYSVFVPIGAFQVYRIWVMGFLIVAIGVYIWLHLDILASLFLKKITLRLWNLP